VAEDDDDVDGGAVVLWDELDDEGRGAGALGWGWATTSEGTGAFVPGGRTWMVSVLAERLAPVPTASSSAYDPGRV